MPRKEIYISDANLPIFDRAVELAGDSLSAVIADALVRFVAAKEAEAKGYTETTIAVGTCPAQGADDTREIKFIGRLISDGTQYTGQTSDRRDRGITWKVYQTRKGKILIHWDHWSSWQGEGSSGDYTVLDRLPAHDQELWGTVDGEFPVGTVPGSILAEAAQNMGQDATEVLDI